jgi:hypothetical protein
MLPKYNADDIVSYEAMEGPMAICRGKESCQAEGPVVAREPRSPWRLSPGTICQRDQFALRFKFDITPKATGERATMDEVGLYSQGRQDYRRARYY